MVNFEIKEKYNMDDFRRVMAVLRGPGGCPWDAEQTHESIRRNLIEEAYELAHAIDSKDEENLKEELGDLMMQVIFHAAMEEEKGNFNLDDVADAACKKLVFRHPHVFGSIQCENSDEVLKTWDEVKRLEKAQKTVSSTMEGVAETLPALWRAEKVQKKASSLGIEPKNALEALDALEEKIAFLRTAICDGKDDELDNALGNVLFSTVALARTRELDCEMALHGSCEKYIDYVRKAEDEGCKIEDISYSELEKLYS
ncbi:MAG: nucleoside triphosphate pyrophosphohydrolase [Oscillospiraceae bacterium]|nr:nucleoside triphosphate pyrophosphohydrolase [Oscillospiraceae bacterium]